MVAHIYAKDSRANLSSATGNCPLLLQPELSASLTTRPAFVVTETIWQADYLDRRTRLIPHICILLLHMFPHRSPRFERQFLNCSRPFEAEGYDSPMRDASLFAAGAIQCPQLIEYKMCIENIKSLRISGA